MISIGNKYKKIFWCILLTIFGFMSAGAASVKLSLETRGAIGVGDKFTIRVTVVNSQVSPNITQSTNVPGAKVLYFSNVGYSEQSISENGRTSHHSEAIYMLTLRATQKGRHTFSINVGGARSNPLVYNIGNGASNTQQQSQGTSATQSSQQSGSPKFIGTGNGDLFLRANVSKTNVFEQEAIVYSVKLYSSFANIRFVGATAAPKFDGFVVEESKNISNQMRFESYNGRQYATAVIAQYIIFPQMKGSLKVSGNTYTVAVDEREYYHDSYFGTMSVGRPLQLNVKPNDLTVNVRALPQPQPANFSGGVGKFEISSRLGTGDFKTNQAASIIYTVRGTGNLKYVKLPELNSLFPKELEVFQPDAKVASQVTGGNVSGTVTFDCSFMPLETGDYKIPDLEFCYFNPSTGRYEMATARGYSIKVGKGKASSKSQTNSVITFSSKLMKGGELSKEHPMYLDSFLYWIFYILPFCMLVASVIVWRRHIAANADVLVARSRKANKLAAKRLKKAVAFMAKGDESSFYNEMLSSLWGYVADKLQIPTSELNRDNIASRLEERGASSEAVDDFINLVDDCEFAKYAPSAASGGLEGIYKRGIAIINRLEEILKKG